MSETKVGTIPLRGEGLPLRRVNTGTGACKGGRCVSRSPTSLKATGSSGAPLMATCRRRIDQSWRAVSL